MQPAKLLWHQLTRLKRIPGLYFAYRSLSALLDGRTLTIPAGPLRGKSWKYVRNHQLWMALGTYEPHMTHLIQQLLQPGDVCYDIGANAGYFTLLAAECVGPHGKVYAFEPVPLNVAIIQKQIHLNNLHAVCEVAPCAVAATPGRSTMVVPFQNAYAHLHDLNSVLPPSNEPMQIVEVTTITLDTWITTHPLPTLIKIDVEGAEYAVLQGAQKLLSSAQAPRLLIATHGKKRKTQVRTLLQQYNFQVHELPEDPAVVLALPPRLQPRSQREVMECTQRRP